MYAAFHGSDGNVANSLETHRTGADGFAAPSLHACRIAADNGNTEKGKPAVRGVASLLDADQ